MTTSKKIKNGDSRDALLFSLMLLARILIITLSVSIQSGPVAKAAAVS